MLNDEELDDVLFAIYYLLESGSLSSQGIKTYKYLEQSVLNIKRGAHLTQRAPDLPKRSPVWWCSKCNTSHTGECRNDTASG